MKEFIKKVRVCSIAILWVTGSAMAEDIGAMGYLSYSWMNAIVNKTSVIPNACPEINTDIYGSGFEIALEKNFYGLLGVSGSHWFPKSEIWSSVGVAPVINRFGIISSQINDLSELSLQKEKKMPNNFEEVNKWKVSDSAYWESQGGVALYLGAGYFPINAGVFAVASGGWGHYFQKTGPNKVYVEIVKRKIYSVTLGVGLGRPNINIQKDFDKGQGFSYEFILENAESIEAFERFMAGDVTKAQELGNIDNSGVNKISDLSDHKSTFSKNFFINTPFISLLSYKASSEKSYSHSEENSVWDESVVKDAGIYSKRRETFIFGKKLREHRSFTGGKVTNTALVGESTIQDEKLYGNFKYLYQSNWGQEKRLRKYIAKVKSLTGLTAETCAHVPAFSGSLGFNQVVLEMNWSDEYVKELIGLSGNKSDFLLEKIKAKAMRYQVDVFNSPLCTQISDEEIDVNNYENYDDTCNSSSVEVINAIFDNLKNYSLKMQQNYNTDKKQFTKYFTKFGQEVWKSPFVFKAFYERGKLCGQDFKYEISGERITRHLIKERFLNTDACTK